MEALASQPENPYAALAEWFKTKYDGLVVEEPKLK